MNSLIWFKILAQACCTQATVNKKWVDIHLYFMVRGLKSSHSSIDLEVNLLNWNVNELENEREKGLDETPLGLASGLLKTYSMQANCNKSGS